jgi:hypothetical protein
MSKNIIKALTFVGLGVSIAAIVIFAPFSSTGLAVFGMILIVAIALIAMVSFGDEK